MIPDGKKETFKARKKLLSNNHIPKCDLTAKFKFIFMITSY